MFFHTSLTRIAARSIRLQVLLLGWLVMTLFAPVANCKEPAKALVRLRTPLEAAKFTRLSTSEEISAYLARLDRKFPQARVETIGTSVQGRPLQALVLSSSPSGDVSTPDRLTVEIIGGQHGTESAGAESLLIVARELVAGSLRKVLDDMDVVLIPNANPDGRDNRRRANANGVNLNVDFVALTQPEERALVSALQRYQPEVALGRTRVPQFSNANRFAPKRYMTQFHGAVPVCEKFQWPRKPCKTFFPPPRVLAPLFWLAMNGPGVLPPRPGTSGKNQKPPPGPFKKGGPLP